MLLSIIVVNWNTKGLLKHFLFNLKDLKLPFTYEVVVVDNGSKDGSLKMLENKFSQIKIISNKTNKGATYANNQGIKAAQGEYILLTNSDIQIPQGALEKLIDFIKQGQNNKNKIVMVGPKLLNPDGSRQNSCFRDVIRLSWLIHLIFPIFRRTSLNKSKFVQDKLSFFLFKDRGYDKPMQVDWVLGSFLLAERKIFDKEVIGLLDERQTNFLWEADIGRRIRNQGMEVWYDPTVQIIHYPHRISAGGINKIFSRKSICHILDWFKYFIKWRIFRNKF